MGKMLDTLQTYLETATSKELQEKYNSLKCWLPKSNELMVGDWVSMDSIPTKVYTIWDKGIGVRNADKNYEAEGIWQLMYIEPIPLTAEILEKNGFVSTYRAEDNGDYKIPYNPFSVHYADDEDGFIWYGEVFGYDIDYSYVHELQHALRLCGLSELADSFIV